MSAGYKQAAFEFHKEECSRCGSKDRMELHHKDRNPLNNADDNVEVLCLGCHIEEHGGQRKRNKNCRTCGKEFWPKRMRQTTCGNRDCITQAKAESRWGS